MPDKCFKGGKTGGNMAYFGIKRHKITAVGLPIGLPIGRTVDFEYQVWEVA